MLYCCYAVLLLCCRLRQLLALGHIDELQAELNKYKQQPNDPRSHLEKVTTNVMLEA